MTDKPINKPSRLRIIFDELCRDSETSGKPIARRLSGGASMLVLVRDNEVRMMISRAGTPLGSVELATFERICVPDGALRWPASGQNVATMAAGQVWRVGWKWTKEGGE